MALTIIFENNVAREWNIGQPSPIMYDEAHIVKEIAASGDELERIQAIFGFTFMSSANDGKHMQINWCYSIPMPKHKKHVRWIGEIAKNIAANLF